MSAREHFTAEALKAQDGKQVPLTLGIGGPRIGTATLHYVPGAPALHFHADLTRPARTAAARTAL